MTDPADTEPLVALAAAVQHTADGTADEIELEWWSDTEDGPERRFTVTVRNGTAVYNRHQAMNGGRPAPLPTVAPIDPSPPPAVPDDLSGLDDLP